MDGHKSQVWEMEEDVRQLIAESDHVPKHVQLRNGSMGILKVGNVSVLASDK